MSNAHGGVAIVNHSNLIGVAEGRRLSMAVALLFRSKSCSTQSTNNGNVAIPLRHVRQRNPVHPEAAPYEGSVRKAHVSGVGLHILPMQASRGRHGPELVDIFYKQIGTSCKWCSVVRWAVENVHRGASRKAAQCRCGAVRACLSVEDLLRCYVVLRIRARHAGDAA